MKNTFLFLFFTAVVVGCVREHQGGAEDSGGFAAREAQEYFEQNAEEFELLGLLSGQAQDGSPTRPRGSMNPASRAVW